MRSTTRTLVAAVAAAGATLIVCSPSEANATRPAASGPVAAASGSAAPAVAKPGSPAPAAALAHTGRPVQAKQQSPKPQATPAAGAPCSDTARACVQLSANRAWLLDGGKVVYGPVPITSGKPGHRTPAGTFHVQWKHKDHRSSEFNNAPMPYSVFFYSGMAFHSGSLTTLSHGCIHLSSGAAKTFFDTLAVGDVVQIVS